MLSPPPRFIPFKAKLNNSRRYLPFPGVSRSLFQFKTSQKGVRRVQLRGERAHLGLDTIRTGTEQRRYLCAAFTGRQKREETTHHTETTLLEEIHLNHTRVLC